uniref:Microtubule-associated protein futsch-like n=1 Tax=Mastacembelus armatus TaxID=205130 RepID=A0A3Q3KU51_9TELE
MKPDGVNMETTEPTEAAGVAEPSSSQDNVLEQAPSQPEGAVNDTAPGEAPKASAKPVAANSKVKAKAVSNKTQPTVKSAGASGSSSQPGTSMHRTVNSINSSNHVSAVAAKKTATTNATKASSTGAVPKRPLGAATSSTTVKNQTKVPDKKPVGPSRTASVAAATVTNGTKPVNGTFTRRPAAETVSATQPKTKGESDLELNVTHLSSFGSVVKAFVLINVCFLLATDVSRPPSAAVSKKPPTATSPAATKKPVPAKAMATVKLNTAPKWSATAKAADPKVSHSKTVQPAKPPTKKSAPASWFPAVNKPPLGQTPPPSSVNKPANSRNSQAKQRTKPTQAVSPYSAVKTGERNTTTPAVEAQSSTGASVAAATVVTMLAETQAQATVALPQELVPAAHVPDEVPLLESSAPLQTMSMQVPAPAEPTLPPVASPVNESREPVCLTEQTPSTSQALPAEAEAATAAANVITQVVHPTNLNEDDDEEKEGSQLVSVSEMSGTTQPTEESRAGSAGLVAGSAWRAGGALLSELDSEDVSGSQQGASELSAPGVLEGTESMDDLGDGSLKGAIDMEGASAGSPDFEKVPDIPVNDYEEEEEDDDDDDDHVCDMDVCSEQTDEPQRPRHDNDVDEEDEDVEMASEGVTESGLESYGNADEDDFDEDERVDNLNRVAQPPPPPPPPLLPSAPAAQWDQPNPFADPWAEPPQPQQAPAPLSSLGMYLPSTLSSETSTPEELAAQVLVLSPQHLAKADKEGEEEAETLPAEVVLGGPAAAPTSNPSSCSVTEDESSDQEGEAQLDDSLENAAVSNVILISQPTTQRCLSTVEEGEEAEMDTEGGAGEDTTPPSATSLASYGFDTTTTASNSNAQSTGESCIKSPGIFSLEELPEEAKEPCLIAQSHTQPCLTEQQYIECGKQEAESAEHAREEAPGSDEALGPSSTLNTLEQPEEIPDDVQPPYYSAICEKTENSFAGFTALPHPHRRDHSAYLRTYCDIVKPHGAAVNLPKLTCADLPPRSPGQQALSPQLRRLEQHQRQLLELQQRREQQNRPLEVEVEEQERKKREEEEEQRKKEEAEEEIKKNKEEEERKMREQAQRWQQELQQSNKCQAVLLSPSSGLCTIYEALENSDGEEAEGEEEAVSELQPTEEMTESKQVTSNQEMGDDCVRVTSNEDKHQDSSLSTTHPTPHPDSHQTPGNPSPEEDCASPCPPASPERTPPLDLDWGKKVDIVQQLINQTLLLNGDSCSSLLLLPGGAGGTLSPLESSLWPSLLPPVTPPSATITSVSSFSPEATGSCPQGEWTVVELETHH